MSIAYLAWSLAPEKAKFELVFTNGEKLIGHFVSAPEDGMIVFLKSGAETNPYFINEAHVQSIRQHT